MGGGDLARIVAFQEALARRGARTVVEVPGGFAVRDDRYPASYENNQLFVTGSVAAADLVACADRQLRDRRYRQVTVLDDARGRRLAAGLAAAGYEQERLLVMVLGARPDLARDSIGVERVGLEALRETVERSWAERYADLPGGVLTQLFERRFATAAACDLTSHVVRAEGAPVAWCHLYRLGRVGQVESVNTLTAWRNRGYARAVVGDAVRAAVEQGCELVFLVADRDDWPRHLYERMGFVPAGEQHSFVRAWGP